jgi:hypothetical protein
MSKADSGASAKGRVPPPANRQFRKGSSGNPQGRPKGSVSLDGLTRKFALKKQLVKIGGKRQKLSRLEIAILKLIALAAGGKPAAARLTHELRALTAPRESEQGNGALLAPAQMTPEAFVANQEELNKHRVEPGIEVNIEHEEFIKAVRGEPSPLGEALLAFHRKYQNPT